MDTDLIRRARELRKQIEETAETMDDEKAIQFTELFKAWSGDGVMYAAGMRVRYQTILYRVLQEHVSQQDWNPVDAPSLFAKVLIPDENVIPEWEQPDSTNPYMKGDKVTHNGKTWVSDIDNNVWEPGVYGWTEFESEG